jgi:hypothetical protein
MTDKTAEIKSRITKIDKTNEKLTGRAGLVIVSRYLRRIGIPAMLANRFSFLRKSSKGTKLVSVFHQLICFFINGEDFHLSMFDKLKADTGYSGIIEIPTKEMLSSHSVKRFFRGFNISKSLQFRKILHMLFIYRLKKDKPQRIILGLDTMVMDNNDADKREGVSPTYKKVKGFQPIHLYWEHFIVDTVFREGKAHSNHGNNVKRIVVNAVRLIRKHYSDKVPIILLADSGFFDENLFMIFDELEIGFIIGGRMYDDIKQYVAETPDREFYEYKIKKRLWYFHDFTDKRRSWDNSYRCIYTKPINEEDGQIILEFDRPESLIYSNLGMDNKISKKLMESGNISNIEPEAIIEAYHNRARDELVNRSFKDFGTERLPFKRFEANSAYYYIMAISFFIFESFKKDMDTEVIPVTWYPSTFRRRFIDAAGKIVHSGRQVILKLTAFFYELFNFPELWQRSMAVDPVLIL